VYYEPKEFIQSSKGAGVMSEVLVVASKVKKLIKDKSGMNTSSAVMEALTKVIERECQRAIEKAQADKRKTVMDRDFE
jgi:histone H3/H4